MLSRPLLALATLLLLSGGAAAWEIESFHADLAVQSDGSLRVTETIAADFQGEERHGIYRDIPLVSEDRLRIRRSIRVTFLEATDENGQRWPARLEREGVFRRIRLGSRTATHSGRKSFRIVYRVDRILISFPGHDELYWNVTGNEWAVPIRRASAVVRLPEPVERQRLLATAYTGRYSSAAGDVEITLEGDRAIRYQARSGFSPLEGLTIVAGWPPGLVEMPSAFARLRWFFQDNWVLSIPLAVFLVMLILWWNFGRDLPRESVTVQYEPPQGMTPGEVGTLLDDHAELRDVTAGIVDLARRGYLTIEEKKSREYRLIRHPGAGDDGQEKPKPHESLLLAQLFSAADTVELSSLENRFYKHLPEIRKRLYEELTRQGYWAASPEAARGVWRIIAIVLFVIGCLAIDLVPLSVALCLFVSGGIVFWFGRYMPRKTSQGMRALERILGLQEFLRRTDEDRLRRESNPSSLFERMLPYAMALGVANQWASAFEEIYRVHRPRWYSSYDGSTFTPSDFTRRVDRSVSRMGTVLASAPRHSGGSGFGGGFSGGGGGGGGGGAW